MQRAYLMANLRSETGKTTLAAHLAASWARMNHKGALLDFDAEVHLAAHLGIPVVAGLMASSSAQEGFNGESAYRLEGDASWRAHLDIFPIDACETYLPHPDTLRHYAFVLIDTPPHDLSCLLRALSVLWVLKRAGWDVQVVVPHPIHAYENRGTRETINFLNTVHKQTGAHFPITLVPCLAQDVHEPIAYEGIPHYHAGPLRSAPPFHVDANFRDAARFGLTVFELTPSNRSVREMEAIAHFLMPTA